MTTCEQYGEAVNGLSPPSPEVHVPADHIKSAYGATHTTPAHINGFSPMRPLAAETPGKKAIDHRSSFNGRPPRVPSASMPTHSLSKNVRNEDNRAVLVSLENFEHVPGVKGVLNSPRSLQACKMEDVLPADLLQRSLTDFMGQGVPEELAQLRYTVFEKRRKDRLERVCRARALLLAEEKKAEELDGGVRDSKSPQENTAKARREAGDANSLPRHSISMSNHHGGNSRSSSLFWRQGRSPSKTSSSRHRRLLWHKPESRSASMGSMLIYSRAITEHRSPSEKELVMLERIEEREQRLAEAKQRVELEEKNREQELVQKQLDKMRKIVNNMIQKEITRNAAINSRRMKWEEQMMRIREQKRRDEEARRFQSIPRGNRASTHQGNGVFRASTSGVYRKEQGDSLRAPKTSSC
ncbi:hypothetical protein TcG_13202 [Trypanosoma cruzi]|nr:hypothetical protein TcG_13202 [Trypanosoma cruzi]